MQIVKIGNKYAVKKEGKIHISRIGCRVTSKRSPDYYLDYQGRGWIEKDYMPSMHPVLIDKLEDAILLMAKRMEEEQPEIVLFDTDFLKSNNSDI